MPKAFLVKKRYSRGRQYSDLRRHGRDTESQNSGPPAQAWNAASDHDGCQGNDANIQRDEHSSIASETQRHDDDVARRLHTKGLWTRAQMTLL